MKIFSLLIFCCYIQLLFCYLEEANDQTFQEAFIKSIPYINKNFPSIIDFLNSKDFQNVKIEYSDLTLNNVQFIEDEFGLLHIKFVNLTVNTKGIEGMFPLNKQLLENFTYGFDNLTLEETIAHKGKKDSNGKYKIKYLHVYEPNLMYNFRKISISETNAIARAFSEYIEKFTLQQLKIRLRMIISTIFDNLTEILNSN